MTVGLFNNDVATCLLAQAFKKVGEAFSVLSDAQKRLVLLVWLFSAGVATGNNPSNAGKTMTSA